VILKNTMDFRVIEGLLNTQELDHLGLYRSIVILLLIQIFKNLPKNAVFFLFIFFYFYSSKNPEINYIMVCSNNVIFIVYMAIFYVK